MAKPSNRPRKTYGTTLAYVRWFDSAVYKGEACPFEDISGYLENESAGILVRETKREVVIVLDRCLDTKDVRLVLSIPRVNIRALRKIRV